MYLGVLTVGADLASGFHAFALSQKISLAFKGMNADFLSRPEGDVYFVAKVGQEVQEMLHESTQTGERITKDLEVVACTGYPNSITDVAKFQMGLSIKVKGN